MDSEGDHISIDAASNTSMRPPQESITDSEERVSDDPIPAASEAQGRAIRSATVRFTIGTGIVTPGSQVDALCTLASENNEPSIDPDAKRFNRCIFYWVTGLALIVACIGAVVSIVVSLMKLDPPATPPSDSPSASPTFSEGFLVELIQSRSPTTSFVKSTSAQSRALDWMLSSDPYTLPLEDDRLVQRFALATLWYSTNSAPSYIDETNWWDQGGWLAPVNECEWDEFGDGKKDLICNTNNELIAIKLSDDDLSGHLPAELGLLSQLEHLELSFNAFTGSMPTELSLLTKLKTLSLDDNALSGTIPTHVGLLTALEELHLNRNALTGSIPTEFGLLTNFSRMRLSGNNLSGTIPTEVGHLTQLVQVQLSQNVLSGTVPSKIGLLDGVADLILQDNALSGSITTEIGLLTVLLNYLELSTNDLSGTIPSSLCGLDIRINVDWGEIACTCCV
jgi:hypothetical protein